MPEPLSWHPNEDGGFRSVWMLGRASQEFLLEPQLARTFSQSRCDYTDEPWLAWTVRCNGEWLTTWRTDWLWGDDFESSIFGLYAAMRTAERFRWAKNYERKKCQRLRRWLRLDRLSYSSFEWWLDRNYPRARYRGKRRERAAEQWERMVEAQAKRRLDAEGREPIRITVD